MRVIRNFSGIQNKNQVTLRAENSHEKRSKQARKKYGNSLWNKVI